MREAFRGDGVSEWLEGAEGEAERCRDRRKGERYHGDDIGDGSGCTRALAWSSTMNKHGCLGSTAAGSAACGWFREPVSMPTDDTNVEAGAPCNSGSSYDGGHGRVLT